MGICCIQKGSISIETNNIYINNKIEKNIQKQNDKIDNNKNSSPKKNNLDNYSSGPILKLLIEKSQNKIEEKSEDEI
jgi:hypothetical protein